MKFGEIFIKFFVGVAAGGLGYYIFHRHSIQGSRSYVTAQHLTHDKTVSHPQHPTHHSTASHPRNITHNQARKASGHPHNVHKAAMKYSRESAADDESIRKQHNLKQTFTGRDAADAMGLPHNEIGTDTPGPLALEYGGGRMVNDPSPIHFHGPPHSGDPMIITGSPFNPKPLLMGKDRQHLQSYGYVQGGQA